MPKRSSNPKRDVNQIAKSVLDQLIGEDSPRAIPTTQDGKNAAAVALGRLGGLKGGKARAEALTAKKRREIAQKAAETRWNKKAIT
jgi:hypothetical protein